MLLSLVKKFKIIELELKCFLYIQCMSSCRHNMHATNTIRVSILSSSPIELSLISSIFETTTNTKKGRPFFVAQLVIRHV